MFPSRALDAWGLTFGRQSAEGPEQFLKSQVVLASHSRGSFAAQRRHHRDKRALDELLHGLGTLGHDGTASTSKLAASSSAGGRKTSFASRSRLILGSHFGSAQRLPVVEDRGSCDATGGRQHRIPFNGSRIEFGDQMKSYQSLQ